MGELERRQRLRDMVTAHHAAVWRFLRRLGLDPSDAAPAAAPTPGCPCPPSDLVCNMRCATGR